MIYLSDDYLTKYTSVLNYLISRANNEKYSFPYIERVIAYSEMIREFENSNVTIIAFSSVEKIYRDLFPLKDNSGFVPNLYDEYGWASEMYIHLFLDLQITFEALFIILPIQEILNMYSLYHEMSYSQTLNHVKELIQYSILDNVMKNRGVSNKFLADNTGISISTINALRYGKT